MPLIACAHCGKEFYRKPSQVADARCCSRKCNAENRRTNPINTPRPCKVCGTVFTPARHRWSAVYCSHRCIWVGTRGPEWNAKVGREGATKSGDTQRYRGDAKTYVKRGGRHEHRVVMESILGRPLAFEEIVHHIDGDKHNNHPDNLVVLTRAQHMLEHGIGVPGKPLAHKPWIYRKKKDAKNI